MLSIKIVVKADFVVLEHVPGYLILYHIWEDKQWGNTKENLLLKLWCWEAWSMFSIIKVVTVKFFPPFNRFHL